VTLHCYLQFGLGDFYDLFTILPDFIEKNKVDRVKFWVDSVYFHNGGLVKQKQSVIDLMNEHGGDYTVIPKECGSFRTLYYDNLSVERWVGPVYEKIKNTFLPHRKPLTQSYMRSRIKYDDLCICALMGINFTYQWVDSCNVPLTDYIRKPVELDLTHEQEFRCFQILQDHDTILQVRRKGAGETNEYFKTIHRMLVAARTTITGKLPLVIDFDGVHIPDAKEYDLSFAEVLHLVASVKYMITSSSVLGCHRLHSNKRTIISTPYRNGSNEIIFTDYLTNPNYLFLNAENDNLAKILGEIATWE
jgi:hypothetical protein